MNTAVKAGASWPAGRGHGSHAAAPPAQTGALRSDESLGGGGLCVGGSVYLIWSNLIVVLWYQVGTTDHGKR